MGRSEDRKLTIKQFKDDLHNISVIARSYYAREVFEKWESTVKRALRKKT